MKKVAILQSNYLPWKGYFHLIDEVDEFVFLDDVQYTSRDWRNRNRIKTKDGLSWLTVPCGSSTSRLIHEVRFTDPRWQEAHWERLVQAYRGTQYFSFIAPFFENIYLNKKWEFLSKLNQYLIEQISQQFLGINTSFKDSRAYESSESKQHKLLDILKQASATSYLSGPSAKSYLQETFLEAAGISLEWMKYGPYSSYEQLYPPFIHEVSIIDVLFNAGPEARKYILPD